VSGDQVEREIHVQRIALILGSLSSVYSVGQVEYPQCHRAQSLPWSTGILVRKTTRLDRPVNPRGRSSGSLSLGAGGWRVAARRGV
jgi:hypothetical protein